MFVHINIVSEYICVNVIALLDYTYGAMLDVQPTVNVRIRIESPPDNNLYFPIANVIKCNNIND